NSNGLTVDVVAGGPAGVEAVLHFETRGEEIKVEDFPNIDFDGFNIKLNMEFGGAGGSVDLVGWVDEIEAAMERVEIVFVGSNMASVRVEFREKVFGGSGLAVEPAKK